MIVTLITARLRFETAGGVTATETREDSGYVLRLRTDATGKAHLPGTTVAGNLRAHCAFDPELEALFGDAPEELTRKHEQDQSPANPSTIQVLGTVPRTNDKLVHHTRNSADRARGAARTHHFHRIQMLRPGAEFDVMLRWDDADQNLRERFLRALQRWRPRLGRGVTRGAGRCRLVGWGVADYDLSTELGLLAWIRDTGIASYPEPSKEPASDDSGDPLLEVDMSIVDAVHCGADPSQRVEWGLADNEIPTHKIDDVPTIPGSSLKGVLRSRAEYICRVVGAEACAEQRCGACVPCGLFGFAGDKSAKRGKIAVDDAPISDPMTSWRPHVAIDRFTGGARNEALYNDEVVASGTFTLRLWELNDVTPAERRLLHAVLDDLHEGYLGIGARTTAGYGTVRADSGARPSEFALSDLATNLSGSSA